ncbi:WXG100 family type VII secretion target [Nocardia alni]|uniref:WXG100 family type VII secretion target n=1 Tax=Nocardia alni TaxID=2815723 RepID=UPI001C216F81|nr:WXG100 family type VII secretion target [Nocardia alni]
MGNFEIEPDEMHSAADTMSRISEDFDNDLARLRKTVRSVVGSSWLGRAAESHDSAWDEFFDSTSDVVAGLAKDATALHRAAAEYAARDQTTGQALGRVGAGLPDASPRPSSLNLP